MVKQKQWKVLAALLVLLCIFQFGYAKRIALVIGNSEYTISPSLQNPVNDATDINKALQEVGFETQFYLDLTRRGMINAIRDFSNTISPGDVALFYYVGHGAQANGQNYLIPVDADIASEDELDDFAMKVSFLTDKLVESGSELNILVLDACRNNPYRSARSDSTGLAAINNIQGQL